MRLLSPLLLLSALPAQFVVRDAVEGPQGTVAAICHDAARGRTVAFDQFGTYEYTAAGWQTVPTLNSPSPRSDFALAYDGARVLLYGGQDQLGAALGDLWAYDGTNWSQVPWAGQGPGLRAGHAMAYDTLRQRLVLFGGGDGLGGFPTDTWEWDGTSWSVASNTGPGSRAFATMAYDPSRSRTVLVGGMMPPVQFAETWEWDGAFWTQASASQPPVRANASLVYDPTLGSLVLVGGYDPQTIPPQSDCLVYLAAAGTWTVLPAPQSLPEQIATAAAFDLSLGRIVALGVGPLAWAYGPDTLWIFGSGGTTATQSPVGQGCVGGTRRNGPPASLRLNERTAAAPVLGVRYGMELQGAGSNSANLLTVGVDTTVWAGLPLPAALDPFGFVGCQAFVAPLAAATMPMNGLDIPTYALSIPNLPSHAGLTLHCQALSIDITAPNGVGATSNALAVTIQ